MPELPEVATTVEGLCKTVIGKTIKNVWADWPRMIREHSIASLGKQLENARIANVRRRGKNILIDLSSGDTMHVHMKMTGHLLFGNWRRTAENRLQQHGRTVWTTTSAGPLRDDPFNRHIRMVVAFTDETQLALSDLRRFAKVGLWKTDDEHLREELASLGPEPLDKRFTFKAFVERFPVSTRRVVKQVLMDQGVVAGIGNIYSDEMLFRAGIHPQSAPAKIPAKKLLALFGAMKKTLFMGINCGGDSTSDYRDIFGKRGRFQEKHLAYRRTGKPCGKRGCNGTISREIIGGRSAHFCPIHQLLYN